MATLVGNLSPMTPGERREFTLESARATSVKGFVSPPTPPAYRSCAECGTLKEVRAGDSFNVTASRNLFASRSGGVEITLKEPGAEDMIYRLAVRAVDEGEPLYAVAGA